MAAPATRNTYSPETVTKALLTLVASPNARKASDTLREQGIEVPHGTLSNWRTGTHCQQYEELAATYGAELAKQAVHDVLLVGHAATEVQLLAIDQAKTKLENHQDREPAQTALNMGKIAAQANDMHARLTGRPTLIIEHKNADDLLDDITRRLGIVDTTAEEETD